MRFKSTLISTSVLLMSLFAMTNPVYAASCAPGDAAVDFICFLELMYKFLLPAAVGVLGIPLIIINGYKIMTSQGDPAKVKDGQEGLTAAVVGIIFLGASLTLLNIILKSFGYID